MRKVKLILVLVVLLVLVNSKNKQKSDEDDEIERFVQQVLQYITKIGLKVLVSPKFLRAQVKIIVEKLIKVSLTKSTLKKIPVLGSLSGIGFGLWRAYNGEYYRAGAQVISGFAGATGIGTPGSLAIDIGILIADVVQQLKLLNLVRQQFMSN